MKCPSLQILMGKGKAAVERAQGKDKLKDVDAALVEYRRSISPGGSFG